LGGEWPSGKAKDFGSLTVGSNPTSPAILGEQMLRLTLFLAILLAGTWPNNCYDQPCPWAVTTKDNTPVYAASCTDTTCHLSLNPVAKLPDNWRVHVEKDVTLITGEYIIVLYDTPPPSSKVNEYGAILIDNLKPSDC
jgi:hypothetical protein